MNFTKIAVTKTSSNSGKTLDELFLQYQLTRGNLCPGTLLGVRMAVLGCAIVGIDYSQHNKDKDLIVWVEIDRWLPDAIEVVTGARLGKRTLKLLDYGKLAATFLNNKTGKAVRIAARESSRGLADLRHPEIEIKYERQMLAYYEASDADLFDVMPAKAKLLALDAPGHPISRVMCQHCGEGVNDGREINFPGGMVLCRPCSDIQVLDFRCGVLTGTFESVSI